MATTGNDCYFYYNGTCLKGDSCAFRHQPAALGSELTCELWKQGMCTRPVCKFRHAVLNHGNNTVQCCWENQPSGCLKPNCSFYHSKPRPFLGNLQEFRPRVPFLGVPVSTTGQPLPYRAPMVHVTEFNVHQEQLKGPRTNPLSLHMDIQASGGAGIPSGIMPENAALIPGADGILANAPHIDAFNVLPIAGQHGIQVTDPEYKHFQERVKMFKAMLNRHDRQEGPVKKDKEKNRRRVIPKHSRTSADKEFVDEKDSKRPEKRENARKKKDKDKTKKVGKKDRSHKSKIKSEKKRRSRKTSKTRTNKDYDNDMQDREEGEISDFSDSQMPNHGVESEGEDSVEVKSYEEILREKALRNLLEKRKMRQMNNDEGPDEHSKARIEEIERELRGGLKRSKLKKVKDIGSDGNHEEKIVNSEDDLDEATKHEDGLSKEGLPKDAAAATFSDEEHMSENEDGEHVDDDEDRADLKDNKDVTHLQDNEDEAYSQENKDGAYSQDNEDGAESPYSSGISLVADDEILSIGEEEEEDSKRKKRDLKVEKTKKKGEKKKDGGKIKVGVDKQKEERIDDSDSVENKANISLDFGIKSFDEIMKAKRQRKGNTEENFVKRQLTSVISRPSKDVSAPFEMKLSHTEISQAEEQEKVAKKLVRKVMVKSLAKTEIQAGNNTADPQDTKSGNNGSLPTSIGDSQVPSTETDKLGQVKGRAQISQSDKEVPVTVVSSKQSEVLSLAVKSFDEIMREKRLRRQREQEVPTQEQEPLKTQGVVAVKPKRRIISLVSQKLNGPSSAPPPTTAHISSTGSQISNASAVAGTDRVRPLLLKRPSSKQKSANSDSENYSISRTTTARNSVNADHRASAGLDVRSDVNKNTLSTGYGAKPDQSIVVANLAVESVDGSDTTLCPPVSSRETTDASVVARVTPFVFSTEIGSTNVGSTCTSLAVSKVQSSEATTITTPSIKTLSQGTVSVKPNLSRQRSETSKRGIKRRSQENMKVHSEGSSRENVQLAPVTAKRARQSPDTGKQSILDNSSEAIERGLERNDDLLSDEELEREIANLSPLSAEDYEDIDEDDLLLEVEAMIND